MPEMTDRVRELAREVELERYPDRKLATDPGPEWRREWLLRMGLFIRRMSREKHGTTNLSWMVTQGISQDELHRLVQPDAMGRCIRLRTLNAIAALFGFSHSESKDNVREFMRSALADLPAHVEELSTKARSIKITMPVLPARTARKKNSHAPTNHPSI